MSTNAAGAFTFTAKIPGAVPAGSHSIVVLYDGVVVSTAAISVAADPTLAATGLNSASLTSLTSLNLRDNHLSGEGAKAIASLQRTFRSLISSL